MAKINSINYNLLDSDDIKRNSTLEITSTIIYGSQEGEPSENGLMSRLMGLDTNANNEETCQECQQTHSKCPGHFGYLNLPLPVINNGFLDPVLKTLNAVCHHCFRILLSNEDLLNYKIRYTHCMVTKVRAELKRTVLAACKNKKICPHCHKATGKIVKLSNSYRFIQRPHTTKNQDVYANFGKYLELHKRSQEIVLHYSNLQQRFEFLTNKEELQDALLEGYKILDPIKIRNIIKRVPSSDLKLLYIDIRPDKAIVDCIPICPPVIRPSRKATETLTNEDDLTITYLEILGIAKLLKSVFSRKTTKSCTFAVLHYNYDLLQKYVALLVNPTLTGFPEKLKPLSNDKSLLTFKTRLSGKQGRFRGNLSGKRVNYTARSVISPDPNLKINELGVPLVIAKSLSSPEIVTEANLRKLQRCVRNGGLKYPGCIKLEIKNDGTTRFLKRMKNKTLLNGLANRLKAGDTVHRQLMDGDYVAFNRQPSLHKHSIMGHKIVVLKTGRTFRFNLCVCNPYNADFDGDEMNVHVPQTLLAKSDIKTLMSVKRNLLSVKTGLPLIAPTQDFITTVYLLTRKDMFLETAEFKRFLFGSLDKSQIKHSKEILKNIKPTIIKPKIYYTGKQLFSLLLSCSIEDKQYMKHITLFNSKVYMADSLIVHEGEVSHLIEDYDEKHVMFVNGKLIFGQIKKALLTADINGFINQILSLHIFGLANEICQNYAADFMNSLSKLTHNFLREIGFSIGSDDLKPAMKIMNKRDKLYYDTINENNLNNSEEVLSDNEKIKTQEFNKYNILKKVTEIRNEIATGHYSNLNKQKNVAFIMANSGSKGSKLNICQMSACLGQQYINGDLIPNEFTDRTLPHFKRNMVYHPEQKGFVRNNFYNGLSPSEYIFHSMAGRIGLIDTAIKTADTGYLQRRLGKGLENCIAAYDNTIRDSKQRVIQFPCENPETGKSEEIVPGSPCGILSCQSIGEPGTQMTLKTFHFAGTTAMSVTSGVPRILELTNATKNPKSPIIKVKLKKDFIDYITNYKMFCKKLSSNKLLDYISCIKKLVCINECSIILLFSNINLSNIASLELRWSYIKTKIVNVLWDIKYNVRINGYESIKYFTINKQEFPSFEELLRYLPGKIIDDIKSEDNIEAGLLIPLGIHVKYNNNFINEIIEQIKNIELTPEFCFKEAIIDENTDNLIIGGKGLEKIMCGIDIEFKSIYTNDIHEMARILGIEAARNCIMTEIKDLFGNYGINVLNSHIRLMADLMTNNGRFLGFTRHDLEDFDSSAIKLASFELTTDCLFDACTERKANEIDSVSESIILGKVPILGSNYFDIISK